MNERVQRRLRRRDFLAFTPTVVFAPLLLRASGRNEQDKQASRLSVRYWLGSDRFPDLEAASQALTSRHDTGAARPRWIAASRLPAGDASFAATGARILLSGPELDPTPPAYGRLSIEVDYDPFQDTRVHAWSYEDRHVPNMSTESFFTVPIHADHGLKLAVETEQERTEVCLQLGSGKGEAQLRRGLYLIESSDAPRVILAVEHADQPLTPREETTPGESTEAPDARQTELGGTH